MSKQRNKRALRALALTMLVALGGALNDLMDGAPGGGLISGALAAEGDDGSAFTLNLNNVDIHSLIGTVSKRTGTNFVVDPRVKARVTVVSAKSMNAGELYQVFLSVLQVHGYAAVPTGDVVKIVPEVSAKQGPVADYTRNDVGDELVTHVVPVENVPAAQLVPILRPLVPQQGHLAAYAATNALIITDRAANIARLIAIIRRIDRPDNEEIEFVRLEHASAAEVVRILNSLQSAGKGGGEAPVQASARLAADERTNSVLISGERAARLRLRGLIAHLDTPLESDGNTRVVYLRYAAAPEMLEVLKGVSEGQAKVDAAGAGGAAAGGGGGSTARDKIDIQADEQTNALIITAPPGEMRSIMSVIQQLDIRRAQVLVEAIIAEISEDNTRQLGVSFAADARGTAGPLGFSNLGGAASELASASVNPAAVGPGLSLALGDFNGAGIDFGFLVRAIASNANNNILSTPSLVTMDNQEAEIIVGQNVPFVTGQTASANNDNPFQTIERQDVGLSLKVKPQINEGDTIKMEIEQEVSNVATTAQANTADIVTNKRSIKTTVLVEDGQTLVLGGLIDDTLRDSEEKVPLLGDIPVLGHLFRYRGTTKVKQNLMIFMHPVILRDERTADEQSKKKYNFLRDRQLQAGEEGVGLLDDATPVLPEFEVLFNGRSLRSSSSGSSGAIRSNTGAASTALPATSRVTNSSTGGSGSTTGTAVRSDSSQLAAAGGAGSALVERLRVGSAGGRTRLVFDIDRDLGDQVAQVNNPDGSITAKLRNARLAAGFAQPQRVPGVRRLLVEQRDSYVYLHLVPEGPAVISHQTLPPYGDRGHRFLIDMRSSTAGGS